MTDAGLLDYLQEWYANRCNGEWEHQYGVKIETLDNPGWQVEVDLGDMSRDFRRVEHHAGADDWLTCWVEDGKFHGACSPKNLSRVLSVFRDCTQGRRSSQP